MASTTFEVKHGNRAEAGDITRTHVPFALGDTETGFESWRLPIELDHFGRLATLLRALHGRMAFTGSRHFQGFYIGRDGLYGNLETLERKVRK